MVVHNCNPSYLGGGDWEVRGQPGEKVSETPLKKLTKPERAMGVAQVGEQK
jgi:hypothetical protein